ncbi:Fmn dependent [Mycena indigotica]|uniref:Fmn dependent n=1 Tax=Mycena indigotica TaxID=2126181 RepID=A0A8H6S0E3_9AGAR|nr:Fmn dependent [Mycena indigotica]KAF7288985.1 Fmn dependent [Mycena indigotica]
MTTPEEQWSWSGYMLSVYAGRQGPGPLGTVVFEEIEAKAKEKLKDYPGAFMYAGGSAGTNSTYRANLRAFEKYRIVPRMLVNATTRNLEARFRILACRLLTTLKTTIFGVKHPAPIFIAPIGVQGIFTAEGELAPARAAHASKLPFILSTASSRPIEDVAAANGNGHRWYQLYWPKTDAVTLSLLGRAKASGFTALVVTLDTMLLGWRPHDLETSYIPFGHGVGVQIGTSDPVFMKGLGREPITGVVPKFPYDSKEMDRRFVAGDKDIQEAVFLGREWLRECNSGLFRSWEDLRFLRENWEGPLVLKGIQNVHDAEKCLECGIDGIVVSNHGGRQVDGAIPSLYALASIMRSPKIKAAQAAGKLTVLFDSGIRTGPDIFKAIALGAQAVLLGRPWVYGGVVAGQAGIEQVIKHTIADLDTTLALAGYRSLSEIHGKAEEVLFEVDKGDPILG